MAHRYNSTLVSLLNCPLQLSCTFVWVHVPIMLLKGVSLYSTPFDSQKMFAKKFAFKKKKRTPVCEGILAVLKAKLPPGPYQSNKRQLSVFHSIDLFRCVISYLTTRIIIKSNLYGQLVVPYSLLLMHLVIPLRFGLCRFSSTSFWGMSIDIFLIKRLKEIGGQKTSPSLGTFISLKKYMWLILTVFLKF